MDNNNTINGANPIMSWEHLLSAKRFGMEKYHKKRADERTEFQRDFDRLIFSSPFRRLQNKTQVFPLPGSIFVHNRLTHSLEVSCVGRSLGTNIAHELVSKYKHEEWRKNLYELGSIVSAACLAHDMGNPPFGHSGEKAITAYFMEGNGRAYQDQLSSKEWGDFTHFEGNANAFRLLTHRFNGRREGGFALTYATLASIVKYPYEACHTQKRKFGFFQSEIQSFEQIAHELEIIKLADNPKLYVRHPLVYLVEAADDICYQVMDIEDSFKLRLLSLEEAHSLLLGFFEGERLHKIEKVLHMVEDHNEQMAYLRSCVIGLLVDECSELFVKEEESILKGAFKGSLIENLSQHSRTAYQRCSDVAYKKIYRAQEVLDIELAGYKIISTLMDKLIRATLNPEEAYSGFVLNRVPSQYEMTAPTLYGKIQATLDYISGMTDVYALDLYRKINGMSLPMV